MVLIADLDCLNLLVFWIGVDGIGVGGRNEHAILKVGSARDVTAVDEDVVVAVNVVVCTCLDIACEEGLRR